MVEPATDVTRAARPEVAASLILYNGRVLSLDGRRRSAQALAIREGTVCAVGSDRDTLQLAGPATRLVDLNGRAAVPGFIETHSHPLTYGRYLTAQVPANTPPNATIADILERIREQTRVVPERSWIRADRYDDMRLKDKRHPTRWDLDSVSPEHLVVLTHVTGHLMVVNSNGLKLAGITRETPDPPGGKIFRDDSGEPNGVLAERASWLMWDYLPKFTPAEMDQCLSASSRIYVQNGVTTVHDMCLGSPYGGAAEISAYRSAIDGGRFLPRVYAFLSDDLLPELGEGIVTPLQVGLAGLGDERFRLGGVKLYVDGEIQGMTAALSQPYTCAPDERGVLRYQQAELNRRVAALFAAGWQVSVHGNGDAGIQYIINAYRAAGVHEQSDTHRSRIEHCEAVREDQLDVMAAAHILPSFFAKRIHYWGDYQRDVFLGPERGSRIFPLRSAERRGIRFALHSDSPLSPVSPLEGIWCAANRITQSGQVLGPSETVSVETALRAYTSDAAYFSFEEQRKGTLEVGKLGDIAVLSEDPSAVPAARIRDVQVEMTIIGGTVVWQSGAHA